VYDTVTGNLFVHHDIPLPSYPLCLAHGQVSNRGTTGNFCAVGTFSPGIEIWNLDVLNALEPSCILGGEDTSFVDDMMKLQMMKAAAGSKTLKLSNKSNRRELRPGSHTDAVIALAWNPIHRQVLASGSADCTVKLWDVTQAGTDMNEKCNAATFTHHRDKVQSLAWHPTEGALIATGSFDQTVTLLDARSNGENVKSVKLTADCEALAWDPFHPEYLTVASEDGTISCWDVREFRTNTPLWSFVANEYGGVSNIAYNRHVPGLMVTCSIDATVTLWDAYSQNTHPSANAPPRSCGNKDMCVGKLYSVDFYPSSPWLLGCGGSGGQLAIWDLSEETSIRNRFDGRLNGTPFQSKTGTDGNAAKEDFAAMMTNKEAETSPKTEPSDSKRDGADDNLKNRKKKKAKGKRKVHKKGK
jgi:periodic tryptophan protein 1